MCLSSGPHGLVSYSGRRTRSRWRRTTTIKPVSRSSSSLDRSRTNGARGRDRPCQAGAGRGDGISADELVNALVRYVKELSGIPDAHPVLGDKSLRSLSRQILSFLGEFGGLGPSGVRSDHNIDRPLGSPLPGAPACSTEKAGPRGVAIELRGYREANNRPNDGGAAMSTHDTNPRPEELEERLDGIMEGEAEPPDDAGAEVATSPDESSAEHQDMAIADAEHKQDPGDQAGGGQHGG